MKKKLDKSRRNHKICEFCREPIDRKEIKRTKNDCACERCVIMIRTAIYGPDRKKWLISE